MRQVENRCIRVGRYEIKDEMLFLIRERKDLLLATDSLFTELYTFNRKQGKLEAFGFETVILK